MWQRKKKIKPGRIDSLVGQNTEIVGDLRFEGGLHVDGTIKGNVSADENSHSVMTLSEFGTVEGEVSVPNIIINGVVIGDVHAREHVELAQNSRVTGNVYYSLIEMAMGAEVNGNLVHRGEESRSPLKLSHIDNADDDPLDDAPAGAREGT